MTQPLRLLNRQSKPRRKLGVLNSDAALKPYLDHLDRMPKLYHIEDKQVPLISRACRWALAWIRY